MRIHHRPDADRTNPVPNANIHVEPRASPLVVQAEPPSSDAAQARGIPLQETRERCRAALRNTQVAPTHGKCGPVIHEEAGSLGTHAGALSDSAATGQKVEVAAPAFGYLRALATAIRNRALAHAAHRRESLPWGTVRR